MNIKQGEAVALALNKNFPKRVIFVKTDVTKPEELEEAFKATLIKFKGLDIVINNAGILNDKQWELQIAINCVCKNYSF